MSGGNVSVPGGGRRGFRHRRLDEYEDGYYWARHFGGADDGSKFVVLRQGRNWWCCGVGNPMVDFEAHRQIVCAIQPPVN